MFSIEKGCCPMMEFLYFPENKLEYIPASIFLVISLILCFLTMRFFLRHSKREAIKAKELEQEILSKIEQEKKQNELSNPTR